MPGHDEIIKLMHSREPIGSMGLGAEGRELANLYNFTLVSTSGASFLGARGRELERLYRREGRSGSFDDFIRKDSLAPQWISERIDRLSATATARWSEGEIRARLMEKAAPDIKANVTNPVRIELLTASLSQDIAGYATGHEPSHPFLKTPEADNAFKELGKACRQEALRRQHELSFLLDDTVAEVKAERDSGKAWLDPATLADPSARAKLVAAHGQFDQAVASADTLLRAWSKMLQMEVNPDPDNLKQLLANKSLKALYDVTMHLFSGLDYSRGPNTAYRLPAVIEAIGERLAIQGQAHSDVAAYGLIAARLAEVPNRDPAPSQAAVFAKAEYQKRPGRAFGELAEDCLRRHITALNNDWPAAGQALTALFGHEGSAGELVGRLDKAANLIMENKWPINKDAYAAVADLTYNLRKMKDAIAAQLSVNKDSVVKARADAEGIIDAAVAQLLALIATRAT